MLEETIIRESATHKLQSRSSVKGVGPPVTFANVVTPKAADSSAAASGGTSAQQHIFVD